LRSGIAAFFVAAALSTPAFSNAFTDLFAANPAPAPAPSTAAAAPLQEECLPQPGRSTASGRHWVYRFDGQRKCWFQAAEDSALARKPVRQRLARRSGAASEQDQPAPRQHEDVEDARAEMPSSAREQPQPAPPEPKFTIVRTVRVTDAAAQVPPAPDLNQPGADQPTPDQPRQLDVETLLAKAPAAGEEVASATPALPIPAAGAKTGGGEGGIASWLGLLMIVLGSVALLSSSRTLWRAVWPVRFPDSGTASAGQDELLRYEPRSVALSVHAARPVRTEAAVPPREATWDEAIGAIAALTTPVSPEAFFKKARNG
jgi:hypothetical protein